MNKKIGFIGGGNMGSAIIGGIINAKLANPENIIVADLSESNLTSLKENLGIKTTSDNLLSAKCDILFLSVKPNVYPAVINQIKATVSESTLIVSIAAGQSISTVENLFGKKIKLVRVMPNTPALVGAGMAALAPNSNVSEDEIFEVKAIFDSFGESEVVGEYLMDAVTGLSGSSPAFVYMFIEALADGAVLEGMPRAQAYKFAAQTVLGSAKMVLNTGKHPGALKDMVCSPGGTTIAGVVELEKTGMRNSVISAVAAATEKSKQMSNK